MEAARALKIKSGAIGLCLAFTAVFNACTVNVDEPDSLRIVSSFPASGQRQMPVFGPYYFVFNRAIGQASKQAITVSFDSEINASNETLYVNLSGQLLAFNTPYTITISRVADAMGAIQEFNEAFSFTTAAGEQEDNDLPDLADTLEAGDIIHGQAGKEGNAPVDNDYFFVSGDSADSLAITVSRLTAYPVICVLPDTAVVLETNRVFTSRPMSAPFTVLMTNRYTVNGIEKNFGREGWYSITVDE